MQAIQCKYLSPTNIKGGRVKASCDAGQLTVSCHETSGCPSEYAFLELCKKLKWTGSYVKGVTIGDLIVFVPVTDGNLMHVG